MNNNTSNFERGHRHPLHLKGKEIGIFYRNRAQKKKKEEAGIVKIGTDISVPVETLTRVKDFLQQSIEKANDHKVSRDFAECFQHFFNSSFEENLAKNAPNLSSINEEKDNNCLKYDLIAKKNNPVFIERYKNRQSLPVMKQQDVILKKLKEEQVLLIVGSTGCGKTTQVPQILLDNFVMSNKGSNCQIICTQPRRISAIAVAERVSYERCEPLGISVGYQIRLEKVIPRERSSILYCTAGILIQKMQLNTLLDEVSIIILDEIHERSVETDLLLALLKKILPFRPNLKVLLMSATVSESDFSNYFNNCSTLYIEGTLFPVTELYLEDIIKETRYNNFQIKSGKFNRNFKKRREEKSDPQYIQMIEPYLKKIECNYDKYVIQALRSSSSEGCDNLEFIEYLIFYICENKPEGAILVFLPSYDKISKLNKLLQNPNTQIGQRHYKNIHVYPLHSSMPTVNQASVFLPPADGIRKIILSTIIAETSITIEDVVYVINTGKTKLGAYNAETNTQILEETWVTLANSQQRRGRAGRVKPGICYHLFTKAREKSMDVAPSPEITRCQLESVILSLKLLHIDDIFLFMNTLLSPPEDSRIERAIELLRRICALDNNKKLTPLGIHLARLPIDPQIGKMVLMGALFRCLGPITSVAAGISFKSPFYIPLGQEKQVDKLKLDISGESKSDHLLIDNVIEMFRDAEKKGNGWNFCNKHFLSISTLNQLERMRIQFIDLLKDARFITRERGCDENENSKNLVLVRAIIAAGLYPNIACLHKTKRIKNYVNPIHTISTPDDNRVQFHPSSINFSASYFDSNYFVYSRKQKSSALYLLDSTMVYPMALILFGDKIETGITSDKIPFISVGKAYRFKCDNATSEVLMELRERLDFVIRKKMLHPSPISNESRDIFLIKALEILLSRDEASDNLFSSLSSNDASTRN